MRACSSAEKEAGLVSGNEKNQHLEVLKNFPCLIVNVLLPTEQKLTVTSAGAAGLNAERPISHSCQRFPT